MDNLVDESVAEHRDASSSSHELPSEPRAKVVSGKHSIFRGTIIDMPWWYKTWPHSGYNHTRANQNLLKETQKSLRKFPGPSEKPKVSYTYNSLEFGKSCEDVTRNHRTSTPHRSQTNGIAERAVRRAREGTSAVLLQSGFDEKWWADSDGMLHLSAERYRSSI